MFETDNTSRPMDATHDISITLRNILRIYKALISEKLTLDKLNTLEIVAALNFGSSK